MTTRFICNALICTLIFASFSVSIPSGFNALSIGEESSSANGDASDELGWISTAGGAQNDFITGTVSFSNQSIITAGWFEGDIQFRDQIDGFGATGGSQDSDFFIAWLNGEGNWTSAIQGGSSGFDTVEAIAVLPNNDVVVAGSYCINSVGESCQLVLGDLDPLPKNSANENGNAFLARMSSTGEWMWSTQIGNQHEVFVVDMIITEVQEIHLAIQFRETLEFNGETIPGSDQYAVLVAVFDETGAVLSHVSVETADGVESIGALCTDLAGSTYMVLTYSGQVVFGETTLESAGYTDVAVGSYSNSEWNWAISAGGSGEDRGWDCDQNFEYGVHVVGEFNGNASFGTFSTIQSDETDFFVAQVNPSGGWNSILLGSGLGFDRATHITVSPQGNTYIAGTTSAGIVLGNDTLPDLDGESNEQYFDVFIGEITPDLTWDWALGAGGAGNDEPSDISIGFDGSPIVSFIISDDSTFANTSLESVGGYDVGVWMYQTDRDGDDILDGLDNCPRVQNPNQANYDGDALGDVCDVDDDNDGVHDLDDDCAKGEMGWLSQTPTDHDSDGCRDSGEDFDDDEDTVFDQNDACPLGPVGWISTPEEDSEGDGCADYDTDEDGFVDQMDNCPDNPNSNQKDTDADGIGDACDVDLDGDGIAEPDDLCPQDTPQWVSTAVNDHDQDGCHDSLTDFDDDADGVLDNVDRCERGDIGWSESSEIDDHDGDGCRDLIEDNDDDDDGVFDLIDNCPFGLIGIASPGQDIDSDGCIDAVEDDDDDGDGITDSIDLCPQTVLGQQVGITGCSQFQLDDDLDGVSNAVDLCQNTLAGKKVGLDGCDTAEIEVETVAASSSNTVTLALYFFAVILLVGAVYVTVFAPNKIEEKKQVAEKTYQPAFISQEE